MKGLLLMLAGVWVPSAQAESDLKASINGDIKTFYVATIPYDNALFEQAGHPRPATLLQPCVRPFVIAIIALPINFLVSSRGQF